LSTHPRTRERIESEHIVLNKLIELMKPFAFTDYVRLELGAMAVLSDSGTITEESSILNFPALNIREAHERPEGMEEAAVMMVGFDLELIKEALNVLVDQQPRDNRFIRIVSDYDVPNVSQKIIRILLSYTSYIRKVVWKNSLS